MTSELIPKNAGSGLHRKQVQRRTLTYWSSLAAVGLAIFYQGQYTLSAKTRAAVLSVVFPGAGYIASANWSGLTCLVLTYALMPVALLAWFGAGGILFPLLLWTLSVPGAYVVTGDKAFEYSGLLAAILLLTFFGYFYRFSAKARSKAIEKRDTRNTYMDSELAKVDAAAIPPPAEADRELTLAELRDVQFLIDHSLKAIDDWSDFTIVDQFQPAALRYQLYEMLYCLGVYQGVYCPNVHSYVSQASRNTIEKALTPKVMSYWRLETLWGKFSTNYDPVTKDNIMVTGFFLEATMLYLSNTGDQTYAQPGALKFKITEDITYDHDIHTMSEALVRQWKENPYCLFPCEPNWIYTSCNFQGATGQTMYDRVFGTEHLKQIIPDFEEKLNTEFTEIDGSILPIRSELTGFTIPGLIGALGDLANSILCRGYLDHIARRMWAIFRRECVYFDDEGRLRLGGLVGADKIDPGNYSGSDIAIYVILAQVAGEFGDEQVRLAALDIAEAGYGKVTTATGATTLDRSKISGLTGNTYVRARLLRHEDWKNLVAKGPSQTALAGPILSDVPYPGVLVAKARSHNSKDLELVLYPSADAGSYSLGVSRVEPNTMYSYGEGQAVKADASGVLRINVVVDGRTRVYISPA